MVSWLALVAMLDRSGPRALRAAPHLTLTPGVFPVAPTEGATSVPLLHRP